MVGRTSWKERSHRFTMVLQQDVTDIGMQTEVGKIAGLLNVDPRQLINGGNND